MFHSFSEIENHLIQNNIQKRIALCGANDSIALEALARARKKGVAVPILIGDESEIKALLTQMGESPDAYEIIHEPDPGLSANLAVAMVYEEKADIPMKGLMQSSAYMTAMAHPIKGLLSWDAFLNEATVFHYPEQDRLLFAGDCALTISPTLEEKETIIKNIAELARAFGYENVNVAILSATENPNPQIPSSMDAEKLMELDWPENITVEGPFALDNALDLEAAKHKGIESSVAGQADILLVPDLVSGNILHKAMHFFGHYEYASVMCGTKSPVIFNSRTDDAQAKYFSILSAILQSEAK